MYQRCTVTQTSNVRKELVIVKRPGKKEYHNCAPVQWSREDTAALYPLFLLGVAESYFAFIVTDMECDVLAFHTAHTLRYTRLAHAVLSFGCIPRVLLNTIPKGTLPNSVWIRKTN